MNIIEEVHNNLLKRKEIVLALHSATNPGMAGTAEKIAEHFKVAADVVAVKSVQNSYGSHDILVKAFVYDSPQMKEKIEPKPKVKKAA